MGVQNERVLILNYFIEFGKNDRGKRVSVNSLYFYYYIMDI